MNCTEQFQSICTYEYFHFVTYLLHYSLYGVIVLFTPLNLTALLFVDVDS